MSRQGDVDQVVGRLAPSPTGALHLGNARSFLLAWLSARQQQGQVLLRIEDIDSPRVKPWALQSTVEDLRWLGLDWDAGPDAPLALGDSGGAIPLIQTHRMDRYRQVWSELVERKCVYPCTCTRSEVARSASAPHESSLSESFLGGLEGPVYPGTCRNKAPAGKRVASMSNLAWRFAFENSEVAWRDNVRGEMRARPAEQLGDFVIARGDGKPAYQLAVVVDDHDMGVTEVVRGDDLIFSTYRQLAILQRMQWQPPAYAHVPLIVGPDGRRLAKRHGDSRLSYFREQGIAAEAIVGYLAWTLNLLERPRAMHARELIGGLDWRKLPHQPTVFDVETGLPELKALSRQ